MQGLITPVRVKIMKIDIKEVTTSTKGMAIKNFAFGFAKKRSFWGWEK
jgi:hypothetical protein